LAVIDTENSYRDRMSGYDHREQWREERTFMTNVKNSVIIEGKKSAHFQTFRSVRTGVF
jgi:hypothetical protein